MPVQSANNDTDTTALFEPVLVTSSLAFLARLEVDVTLRSSTGQYDEGYEHCVTVWLDAASHVKSSRHRGEIQRVRAWNASVFLHLAPNTDSRPRPCLTCDSSTRSFYTPQANTSVFNCTDVLNAAPDQLTPYSTFTLQLLLQPDDTFDENTTQQAVSMARIKRRALALPTLAAPLLPPSPRPAPP